MTLNPATAKSIAIYVLGLAGVVIGAIPDTSTIGSLHAGLVIGGAIIIAVERYLQGNPAAVAAKKAV